MHSFQDMETVPAIDATKVSDKVKMLIEEIKKFKQLFLESILRENDLKSFWLRKTKKPVLAVLLIQVGSDELILYRGTNMEVSMPTGSLCAERNVIGTALATHPHLKREHIKMIAVLAVPLPGEEKNSSTEAAHVFSSLSQDNPEDLVLDTPDKVNLTNVPPFGLLPAHVLSHETPARRISLYNTSDADYNACTHKSETTMKEVWSRHKRTVVVHSHEVSTHAISRVLYFFIKFLSSSLKQDINPLSPCGACGEWLKKIAEANPYFKVITFTDVDCNGVYINSCQD